MNGHIQQNTIKASSQNLLAKLNIVLPGVDVGSWNSK